MKPIRKLRVVIVSPTLGSYGGIEAFVPAVAGALKNDNAIEIKGFFKKAAGCRKARCQPKLGAAFSLWDAGSRTKV